MNVAIHDIVAIVSYVAAVLVAVISVRHKLVEVAEALKEIAQQWGKNREIGQEKDKVLVGFRDLIAARLDAGLAEVKVLIEQTNTRCEQRHQLSDAKYSGLAERVASAETTIKELAILIKVQP